MIGALRFITPSVFQLWPSLKPPKTIFIFSPCPRRGYVSFREGTCSTSTSKFNIFSHKSPARDEATCQKPGVWSLLFAGGPLRPGRDFAREKYAKPKMKETWDLHIESVKKLTPSGKNKSFCNSQQSIRRSESPYGLVLIPWHLIPKLS